MKEIKSTIYPGYQIRGLPVLKKIKLKKFSDLQNNTMTESR